MNPYANEEPMWRRLQDLQREGEIRAIVDEGGARAALDRLWRLARRAWLIAGLAMRRPPRPAWVDERQTRSRAS